MISPLKKKINRLVATLLKLVTKKNVYFHSKENFLNKERRYIKNTKIDYYYGTV